MPGLPDFQSMFTNQTCHQLLCFYVSIFRWMALCFCNVCVTVALCYCVPVFLWGWGCVCNVSMRRVFTRTVCRIILIFGEGKVLYIPQIWKESQCKSMLIKYLICIICCLLIRHVFLRMVCWMVMILGEGKASYCSQTGKELQPNTSHNM